jgi:hypothetical protein
MLKRSRRWVLGAMGPALLAGCGVVARGGASTQDADAPIRFRSVGAIPRELQWARTAWRYVENNTDYDTGLVAGSDRTQIFTVSNAADALAATIAARELKLIDARELDLRLSRLLGFLGTIELSGGKLPNKAYNTFTGKMVGFDNREADIGWSALDIGRLLLWLKIAGQRHPRFAEYADKAVLRWSFCDVIDDCGVLYGTARSGGQLQRYQEGRLGYEQLAAAGYAAWGFETRESAGIAPTQATNIYGIPVRYDARDARTSGAQTPVLTMPYVLAGLELGWAHPVGEALKPLADTVYKVQEERWRRDKQFTARTDYQLRTAPYVVLDSVFAAGYAWNTIANDGSEHEKLALVSTRAAFGMQALWPTDYTRQLLENVRQLYDPDRGWFEGRFESGAPLDNITLATNAAILEVLMAKAVAGPLLAPNTPAGPFQVQTGDPFLRLDRCWPRERAACKPQA